MVATREIEQSAQQFRGNNKYGEKNYTKQKSILC